MEAGAGPEALVAGSAGVSLSNKTADWWWLADSAMYLTWADPVGTYLYKSMLFLEGLVHKDHSFAMLFGLLLSAWMPVSRLTEKPVTELAG